MQRSCGRAPRRPCRTHADGYWCGAGLSRRTTWSRRFGLAPSDPL